MAVTTFQPYEPKPFEPVDPTNCPTCLSGLQPVDPGFESAIDARY